MAHTSGCALHGRGIGPFAALGEPLLDKRSKIGQLPDFSARFAFAAKIIRQALAVGRLREHSREREFSNAPRAGEQHRMRHAFGGQHPAQCGDDARVAEKI
jgi:hypothetical protein